MQTQDKTHNGWANYATWRVHLEIFDGYDPDGTPMTAQLAEDYVSEWLADALRDVNWQEIADAINEAHDLTEAD